MSEAIINTNTVAILPFSLTPFPAPRRRYTHALETLEPSMILNALIAAFFFAGFVAVLAIPWMTAPSFSRQAHTAHDEPLDH